MPVLDLGRDVDTVAGVHLHGVLALFLVVAAACYADQDLAAAVFGVDAVVVSVLAEENIIVVMRKGRSKCAKSIPASGLYDLFHKSKTSCCSCPGGAGHWITASV